MSMSSTQGKANGPQHESLVGRTLHDGEYAIQRVLGHGGMGNVYLALHTTLKVPLALKQARADQPLPESVIAELDYILHGGDITLRSSGGEAQESGFPSSGGVHTDRFLRESLLLTRLQHAAIPTLYDYFFEDGYWYLVMDYIPGSTLSSYIRRYAPLAPLEALNYAMQLCDVLDYLHGQMPSIIFRDLKPSNIILTPDGALMLVDFGIARYFKEGQVNDTTDFGSPGYASPEQYQGEGQTDGRSDLFSLGVILYEMLSGKRPSDMADSLNSLASVNPVLSTVLSGLVTLATRTEPGYRFQSAHTFYLALERAYAIEERRAYERYLLTAAEREQLAEAQEAVADEIQSLSPEPPDRGEQPQEMPLFLSASQDMQGEALILPAPSRDLEQRRRVREALQQARREREEQEQIELQLACFDENLKRRSLPSFSEELPALEDPEDADLPVRIPRHTWRVVRAGFVVAFLMLLVLSSSLAYMRFSPRPDNISQGQSIRVVPTSATGTARVSTISSISSSWQLLPSLPAPEADNAAVYVREQGREYVYVSGGYQGTTSPSRYDRHLYRYDIDAAHWEQMADGHLPGMLNNAAVQDGQGHLFFTAGYSTETYAVTSRLYMYRPDTGAVQAITPPSQVSIGFGGAMLADQQGHLYLTQGFMKAGDPHARAGTGWYRYDIGSGQWHTLAPLPGGLGYVLLTFDNDGGILLLGGAMDAGQRVQTDRIYRYDIAGDTWTQEQATLPQPLSGAAGCSNTPDLMVVVGGYDATHNMGLSQVWLVNLRTLRWTKLATLPSGGSVLGTAVCDGMGHVFVERGADSLDRPTLDFWNLTIR